MRLYYNKYLAPLGVLPPLSEHMGKEDSCSSSSSTIVLSKQWFTRGKKHMLVDKTVTQDFMASFAEEIEGFSGREVKGYELYSRQAMELLI